MSTNTLDVASPAIKALSGKYLSFTLGGELFGLPVLKVREIIRLTNITPIPKMPPFLKGVINLRGKIVPVVDLRIRFNLENAESTERTCIIVAQVKMQTNALINMGLIVDGVEEVLNIAATDIESTPDFGSKLEAEFIQGLAKVKGKVTALLDIDRVLAGEQLEKIKI
jgi:purine-binding chemotaxis protein CheW